MPHGSIPSHDSLIPQQPLPSGAEAFTRQMQGLLGGHPKDEQAVTRALEGLDDMFDKIAAGLYSLASMLVGEGEDGGRLVLMAISTVEISAGQSLQEARQDSRRALCAAAIETLVQRQPGCLDAPEDLEPAVTCIEDDDLEAAGSYGEELERMIAGPDRDRVRNWLEGLPIVLRTVFVLRAVAGFSALETAAMLEAHGGPGAAGWTAGTVRELSRQGLCSLASQLQQATTAQ
jgi:DNA-directed RNA polymerase specialized sigma24 family protein